MAEAPQHLGPEVDESTIRAIRRDLLRWYARHRRDLPWRAGTPSALAGDTPDPYHVLVSEAMLQQTQVATVIDYFQRFVAEFPTVHALAAADEQRVLRAWQGLGYYRRARHLHAAAKAIVERHAGAVPVNAEALATLPGVGPYTAGAIASIAFGQHAPILDGNVARVFARLFAIDQPIDATPTRQRLWALAADFAKGPNPGDANQALMELGATVCTPRSPRCLTCPVRTHCRAADRGQADQLPAKLPRRKATAVTHVVLAIPRPRNRKPQAPAYLFEQRDDHGLWAGMWQMPTCEDPDAQRDLPAWLACRHGLRVATLQELTTFTHATTHRTITFRVLLAPNPTGRLSTKGPPRQWATLDALDPLPLANPQRRIVTLLTEQPPNEPCLNEPRP